MVMLLTFLWTLEGKADNTLIQCFVWSPFKKIGPPLSVSENYDPTTWPSLCDEKYTTPKQNCNDNCEAQETSTFSAFSKGKMHFIRGTHAKKKTRASSLSTLSQREMQSFPRSVIQEKTQSLESASTPARKETQFMPAIPTQEIYQPIPSDPAKNLGLPTMRQDVMKK